MSLNAVAGKPGTQTGFSATPVDVFYNSRANARFIPGPVTVDGTASGDPGNTPYIWLIRAGNFMGRTTTGGKFASSIIGTIAAYTSGGTTLTVSAAAAAEVARRIGTSGTGTLKVVGPPTAAGTVAVTSVTFSAVNTTSGAITVTSLGVDKVIGSLLVPADGSEVPLTVLCDEWGTKVIDALNTTRTDVFDAELWASGGIMDLAKCINVPADTSTLAWLKAQIRTANPGAQFKDDIINT